MTVQLTPSEEARIQEQVVRAQRRILVEQKPDPSMYAAYMPHEALLMEKLLSWSKLSIPVIAGVAIIASAVRTLQASAEIYAASGSSPVGVYIAAICFTVASEGALFSLALAQESQRLQWRRDKRPRNVLSITSVWHSLRVRLGMQQPKRYDEIESNNQIGLVMLIAFAFAVTANIYLGYKPLIAEIGAVSLQQFLVGIWTAPAELQLTFLVDTAAVLLPPLMALTAGHLTATFAAEIADQGHESKHEFDEAMKLWRTSYTNPLNTEEGEALLQQHRELKLEQKRQRYNANGDHPSPLSQRHTSQD